MDNLNKVISFALGLLVVVIFLALFSGRIRIPGLPQRATVTTTPTPPAGGSVTPTPTRVIGSISVTPSSTGGSSTYHSYQPSSQSKPTTSSIPSTGAPTLFIPTLLSMVFIGTRLRNTKRG